MMTWITHLVDQLGVRGKKTTKNFEKLVDFTVGIIIRVISYL